MKLFCTLEDKIYISPQAMQLYLKSFDSKKVQKSDFPYHFHRDEKKRLLIQHYGLRADETERLAIFEHNHGQKSDFFSASYSEEWFFLAFDQVKIGIDIEVIKPRNPSLLAKQADELSILWASNRINFYRIWTAKEAILKASNTQNLDLLWQIKLIETKNTSEIVWEVRFDQVLIFEWNNQHYKVKSFSYQKTIGAVSTIPHQ